MSAAIPLAALIISIATLIGANIAGRRIRVASASRDWVADLQERVRSLEGEIRACLEAKDKMTDEVKRLRDIEFDLMRRLLVVENKQG